MTFDEKSRFFKVLFEKTSTKRTNLLKQVQFSPIWTKLCQHFANMIIKLLPKSEGHHYPNKGVNEVFFSKKNEKIFESIDQFNVHQISTLSLENRARRAAAGGHGPLGLLGRLLGGPAA